MPITGRAGSTGDMACEAPLLRRTKSESLVISSPPIVPRVEKHVLVVPPFRLARGRQIYLLAQHLRIDLRRIEPDLYQLHVVQDFWTDDDNPNLNECIAGIFLARRRSTGAWDTPERWPTECRSLGILGTIDARRDRYAFSAQHGD